jgi:hypothetical protein
MAEPATFLNQPCKPYRNFQLVFAGLTLMFLCSSFGYTFVPDQVIDSFSQINELLGGGPLELPDRISHFWRLLGCGNVIALALCCWMLLRDLRRNYPVLYPLALMKGFVSVAWAIVWLTDTSVPFYGVAAGLDGATLVAIVYFARSARAAIEASPGARLVALLASD